MRDHMKIVIAMDSFKGTLASDEAGKIVKEAFVSVMPEAKAEVVCVADGGEGMASAMIKNIGGELLETTVEDPLGRPVKAAYVLAGETAVIEMAEASGLMLLNEREYDPCKASTYGTGQLIKKALDEGARRIIVGLGGSATNDGGAGMAMALGVSLRDGNGLEIAKGGAALRDLCEVDVSGLDGRLRDCEIIAACDVDNVLCGIKGATRVYGPQKGVTEENADMLDNAIAGYAALAEKAMNRNAAMTEGAGAAGGLGFGLLAFCGAKVRPGIDVVLEAAGFQDMLADADLLITGEGCIDRQTANGKTPVGTAKYADASGVPVIAIAGQMKAGYEGVYKKGICAVFSCVSRVMTWDDARKEAREGLDSTAGNIARLIKAARHL